MRISRKWSTPYTVFRKKFRDDIRCHIFWFPDCSHWNFVSGPPAVWVSKKPSTPYTVFRQKFREDLQRLIFWFADSSDWNFVSRSPAVWIRRESSTPYTVCRKKFRENIQHRFSDSLIVHIKIPFWGHLLWEFPGIHRLPIPCSGRGSEKTFNAEFFHSLIVFFKI